MLRLGQRLRVTRSDLMVVLGVGEQSAQTAFGVPNRAGIEPPTAPDNDAIARALALMLLAFRTAMMVNRQQLAEAVGIDAVTRPT